MLNILPLTISQKRLWVEWKINPESPAYNLNLVFKLTGPLNINSLQESFRRMIEKYESLRTYFIEENGEPLQMVLSPEDKIFDSNPLVFLEVPLGRKQAEIKQCIRRETHKPFDLKKPFLYRFSILKHSNNVSYLIITMHHIISDGASLELFVHDLSKLYNTETVEQEYLFSTSPTLSDYLKYESSQSTLDKQSKAIEYWKHLMADMKPHIDFKPTQKNHKTHKSSTLRFVLEKELTTRLEALATRSNTTLFMVLITAFDVLLYRYFNSKNLSVGYAVNIRPKTLKNLFGFYVNNIPLKTTIKNNQTFRHLLALNSAQRKNDRPHQELSLQEISKALKNKNNPDNLAPFNVSFNQVSCPVLGLSDEKQGLHLKGLQVEPIPIDIDETHFDLTFLYAHNNEQVGFSVDYRLEIFETWFIEQMINHFLTILRGVVQDPSQEISRITLLTKDQKEALLSAALGPVSDYPIDQTPIQLFEHHARLSPRLPAIIHHQQSISYQALNEKANQFAHFLLEQDLPPQTLIVVSLERSIDYIISILAIAKAGYAYVPIDPKCPIEKIQFILQDTQAPIFIARRSLLKQENHYSGMVFSMPENWDRLSKLPIVNPNRTDDIQRTAYTIYTSGTTGIPKGVQISTQSLLNLIFWHQNTYSLQENCQASVIAGEGFDASVWEIWPYLTSGSTVHIADQEIILDTEKLAHWLIHHKINVSFLPTPVAEILITKAKDFNFPDLRFILTGGDQLKIFLPEDLPFKLFNHYGPTENTVVTTYTQVLSMNHVKQDRMIPSIGKPITNVETYVLDPNRQLVPYGVVGELYIGGAGLAQGYLNQPALTKECFVPNPFFSTSDKLLYKTGDLVRLHPEGDLDFFGRLDKQVKLRGFRIELSEIESQLLKHPAIEQCAVLLKSDNDNHYLVAYLVCSSSVRALDTHTLQEFLAQSLPRHMIPSVYVLVDQIPLTFNGKIDKKALLAFIVPQRCAAHNDSPRTETEKKLLEIWSKVLKINQIGIFDDFFALGGHSLLISAVILAVKKSFNVDIPFRNFFEKPTIAHLAHLIDTTNNPIQGGTQTVDDNTFQLRQVIILDPEIRAITQPAAPNQLKNLLITGVTGFLGAFLLTDLYRFTQATIYCLMRATSVEEAEKRLKKNLLQYGMDPKILESERIKIILGDLAKPRLGLSNACYAHLAQTVDSIYHNAAHVHHIYSYNMLEAENVFSTIEMIKLACLERHKHIHYISAVSAARENVDQTGAIIEDFLKQEPNQINITDGYNQSKLASELLLHTAHERGISVHIYRPAWIGGDSHTGSCAPENQHLFLLIKGCIQMGLAPDWRMELNILPVNFISRFIALVSTNTTIPERVFNLVNLKPLDWLDLIAWIRDYGYNVSVIPKDEWRIKHLSNITQENALYPLVPLYIGGETSQKTQKQIQGLKIRSQHTEQVSRALGLSYPEIDSNMLACYFRFLINTRFIQAPPQKISWHKNLKIEEKV